MEGVVAKRCLRQSSLKGSNNAWQSRSTKETYNNVYRKNLYISKKINKEDTKSKNWFEKKIFNLKMSFWMQCVGAMCLAILLIVIDILNINHINNNKYMIKVKEEYNKSYSITDIKDKGISLAKYSAKAVIKIVPERVQNKFKSIYVDVKEAFSNNENNSVIIYQEENKESIKEEINIESNISVENEGVGASIVEVEENVEEEEVVEVVSAISSEDNELKYIRENNITFVMPTKGKITSVFGAREVIFTDIDPFHTGLDIANVKGTNIMASTNGVVTKVANNKYNGNFVEITNGKVITKYAHMDSVSIKNGIAVKAGDVIGKMGETGYATGPHLHFEVVVDGVKIDPAKVLNM